MIADIRGWASFSIGEGLLAILGHKRTPHGTETIIGPGTVVLALLVGVLNAVAGTMLWSQTSN